MTTHAHSRETTTHTSEERQQGPDEAIDRMLSSSIHSAEPAPSPIRLTLRDACPVFAIGAQLGRLVAEHSRQDNRSCELAQGRDRDEKADAERCMQRAQQGIDLLQAAAGYQQATSVEGALAQTVIAYQALTSTTESQHDEVTERQLLKAAERCLFSVAKILSAATGLSPRAFGSDYFMPEHVDALGMAWSIPRASYVVPGPKPTIDLLVAATHNPTADAVMAAWKLYAVLDTDGTPAGDAALDRVMDLRSTMLDAIEALPLTRENLLAKTLALAWIEYVDQWTEEKPRSAYATDGRLALDIHAIVTGGSVSTAAGA